MKIETKEIKDARGSKRLPAPTPVLNVAGLFGRVSLPASISGTTRLSADFGAPPFSILDSRLGPWQTRKRWWRSLGIRSEEGRDGGLTFGGGMRGVNGSAELPKTSIFDPVLCELAYRWFCPPTGQIVDPFAGGSVRGIVAGVLGYKYWGCDLSKVQILANRAQAEEISMKTKPKWVVGDSSVKVAALAPEADFIFSCPPYGNLEVYSKDPADLSNMTNAEFLAIYAKIIKDSVDKLKDDSFACFVVGDYRLKSGMYANFVSNTIAAFEAAGMGLYNEAMLLVPIGTASLRARNQFTATRKLVKLHQNVLVFCKGDPKKATENIINGV